MNSYVIYSLNYKNRPFYIGQTRKFSLRIRDHRYQARWGNPVHVYNKIRKIWSENGDFSASILESGLDLEGANRREKFYISLYRDMGVKLCNLTDGGDGNLGHVCPEHIKEKLRLLKTGRSWGKHSEITKKLLSKLKQGAKFSEAHKEKLSTARRKRVISAETREKCSATSKGTINIKVATLVSPSGEKFETVKGLSVFCEQHGLTMANLSKVVRGERPHHKGWRLKTD